MVLKFILRINFILIKLFENNIYYYQKIINLLNIIILFNKFISNMGIGDWGLGIGDWGLGPIPNPQSPIPNPQSR